MLIPTSATYSDCLHFLGVVGILQILEKSHSKAEKLNLLKAVVQCNERILFKIEKQKNFQYFGVALRDVEYIGVQGGAGYSRPAGQQFRYNPTRYTWPFCSGTL